jgi:hypothetical protein
MNQILLALFGVSAIFTSQSKDIKVRKYSPILGLASQPFWFYSAYAAEQWGIFVLCFFYTMAWLNGLYNYWIE